MNAISQILLFLVVPFLAISIPIPSFAAYNNGYTYRRAVTIDYTKVSGSSDLSNFPVLVDITNNSLRTTGNSGSVTNSNGYDIIFTAADGTTQLDHEVETYTAASGHVVAWVRVPTLSHTANTTLYLYYGNSSVSTSQTNPAGVWDSSYTGVYHLMSNTDPLPDSRTSSANNLTRSSSATNDTGIINGGLDFASNGTYLSSSSPNNGPANIGPITLDVWVWVPSTINGDFSIFGIGSNAANGSRFNLFYVNSVGKLALEARNMGVRFPAISTDTWHHIVATGPVNATMANLQGYVDGAPITLEIDVSGTLDIAYGQEIALGTIPGHGGYRWIGKVDEARLSKTQRSTGYIATEYANESAPGSFYTLGSEETPWGTPGILSCTVATSCPAGVVLYRLYDPTGNHAEMSSQSLYPYMVCCTGITGLSNSCSGTYATILKLSSTTNAHVEEYTQTNYSGNDACLSVPSGGYVHVGYQATNCSGFHTTVGSITATTNSHVGDGDAYIIKVCASAQGPSILTFSVSDDSIGFGTLSSIAARYATSDTTGSATEVVAHTLAASTNAVSGYSLTIRGTTLTSGGNTITAIGGTNTASSPGSEQFGLRLTASGGSGTVTSPYAASGFAYNAGASTAVQVASATSGDEVTTTYSARYIANITGSTEAGAYATTLTYIVTGSF